MTESFEKTLRDEVQEISDRLGMTESKAFAVWYGKVALRLTEQEAIEAASYDGGNDRGADLVYVGDEWERVIIAQWRYYKSSSKTPSANDLARLFNVPTEFSDPQDLRDDGRDDLAEAAEALADARSRGYALDLRFFYPGRRNLDRLREPIRLIRSFNREHATEEITVQLVGLDDLELAYEDFKGSARRVAKGTLKVANGEFFEEQGASYGDAYVATVPGTSLAALYAEHGDRLFDENVRLFLGSRKGSVNAGIRETLRTPDERGNFWAYNNGITVVARRVDPDDTSTELELTDFSIVNGCQTTVSIAEAGDAAAKDVSVVARVIAADDPALVEKIIEYTNSQNPINVWDISARDKLQQRLRRELGELDKPWFYALRRGELETLDKSKFGKHGSRRILPFPLSAQYLAAFRGFPVEAYKEKALLFTTHKNKVFPPDTEARDVLWAWAVGQACEKAIPMYRKQMEDDAIADAIVKRGAHFFITSIAAQLLRARNGDDFAARVDTENLFSKAMAERLRKYATLATIYYVQIMRGLVKASQEAIGTLIRRPETTGEIATGVRERLMSEELAPEALAEKLPKLPGIK